MNKYKAVVIGCGSIGALKPDKYDSPETSNILTMAHAFYQNHSTDLIAVCDANWEKAQDAAFKWKGIPFINIDEMLLRTEADIIAVCVPTEDHFEVLSQLPKHKPKVVIVEKPFCLTLDEATAITNIYKQANIPLMVNYTRRYLATTAVLEDALSTVPEGEIYHVRAIYGKTLFHEGCHALDLLYRLLGHMNDIYYISPDAYSIKLGFDRCTDVELINIDHNKCSIFDIDIFTSQGRHNLTHHGLHHDFYPIVQEDTYGDYPALSNRVLRNETDLCIGLSRVVSSAINSINKNPITPDCTAEDAIQVHSMIDRIEQYRKTKEKF